MSTIPSDRSRIPFKHVVQKGSPLRHRAATAGQSWTITLRDGIQTAYSKAE